MHIRENTTILGNISNEAPQADIMGFVYILTMSKVDKRYNNIITYCTDIVKQCIFFLTIRRYDYKPANPPFKLHFVLLRFIGHCSFTLKKRQCLDFVDW